MNFFFVFMILAWIVGVPATFLFLVRIYAAVEYQDSVRQKLDRARGLHYSFPLKVPATLSAVSIAYLIGYYFG